MQPKGNAIRLVEDIREIKDAITKVKDQGDEWYTNFYISDNTAEEWLAKKQLWCWKGDNAYFMLRRKKGFSLLYYFASSVECFSVGLHSLINIVPETLSVDILHKMDSHDELANIFQKAGFDKRIRLYRMRRGKSISGIGKHMLTETKFAEASDAVIIDNMLHDEFDELCEQIPERDEIESAIKKNKIMVIKEASTLVSFFWLERNGKTVLWRYWLTNPLYRTNSLAGIMLLRQAMALYEDAVQTLLWVREDNVKVIKAHEKNGFRKDGLLDDVYCLIR